MAKSNISYMNSSTNASNMYKKHKKMFKYLHIIVSTFLRHVSEHLKSFISKYSLYIWRKHHCNNHRRHRLRVDKRG